MTPPENLSRFAALSAGHAWAVLLVTLSAVGGCVYVSLTQTTLPGPIGGEKPAESGEPDTPTDVDFYRNIIARVRRGQGYYDAVGDEFKEWHYQPTSLFNWRTPVYAWVIGKI